MTSGWRVTASKALPVCVLIGSIAAAYSASSEWVADRGAQISRSEGLGPDVEVEGEPYNPFASEHGTNLIVYLFVDSQCGWSQLLAAHDPVHSLRAKVRSVHGSYAQVRVIGVDLDEDLEVGLRFLETLGNGSVSEAFDQIIVGGSWLNDHMVRLAWREGTIEASTPQVLIIERPVDVESYASTYAIELGEDRVVANLVGHDEITEWMREGYPIKNH